MRVGLFVPCYIDQFYPQVAVATLELLERHGCEVDYPMDQTCCGQPLANAGMEQESIKICQHFADQFAGVDYVVTPSGSCAHHVQHNYPRLVPDTKPVAEKVWDLTDFLVDVVQIGSVTARFEESVGLHIGCHSLRGLRQAKSSELQVPEFSKPQYLLDLVDGLELVSLSRQDECCGFGGTFAVNFGGLSAKMGADRLEDHIGAGAKVIASGDMSCLMHLDGINRRQGLGLEFKHISEILNSVSG